MLLKPLIVHPFDIRYRTDAAVVFVVGVTAAVVLIGINDGQSLDKMLPRVVLIVNQLVIEAQNLGAKEYGRIRRGVYQTLMVNVGLSAVLGVVIILFSKPLVNLFLGPNQPAVTALAQTYFHFNASMYWLLAILFTIRNLLQGLGQTLVPTVAGFFELGMRAFAAIFLVVPFGFAGASAANPLAWFGSVLVLVSSYVRTMRRIRQQEDELAGHQD